MNYIQVLLILICIPFVGVSQSSKWSVSCISCEPVRAKACTSCSSGIIEYRTGVEIGNIFNKTPFKVFQKQIKSQTIRIVDARGIDKTYALSRTRYATLDSFAEQILSCEGVCYQGSNDNNGDVSIFTNDGGGIYTHTAGGISTLIDTNDGDSDSSNEIQSLNLLGDTLLISESNSIILPNSRGLFSEPNGQTLFTQDVFTNGFLRLDGKNYSDNLIFNQFKRIDLFGNAVNVGDGSGIVQFDALGDGYRYITLPDVEPTSNVSYIKVVDNANRIKIIPTSAINDFVTTNSYSFNVNNTAVPNGSNLNFDTTANGLMVALVDGVITDTLETPYISAGGTDDQIISISNDTIFLENGGFAILPKEESLVHIEGALIDYTTTDANEDFEVISLNNLVTESTTAGYNVDINNNILASGFSISADGGLDMPAGEYEVTFYIQHPTLNATGTNGTVQDVGRFLAGFAQAPSAVDAGNETFDNAVTNINIGYELSPSANQLEESAINARILVSDSSDKLYFGFRSAVDAAGIEDFVIRRIEVYNVGSFGLGGVSGSDGVITNVSFDTPSLIPTWTFTGANGGFLGTITQPLTTLNVEDDNLATERLRFRGTGNNVIDIATDLIDDQTLSRSNDTIFLDNGGFVVLPTGSQDLVDNLNGTLGLTGSAITVPYKAERGSLQNSSSGGNITFGSFDSFVQNIDSGGTISFEVEFEATSTSGVFFTWLDAMPNNNCDLVAPMVQVVDLAGNIFGQDIPVEIFNGDDIRLTLSALPTSTIYKIKFSSAFYY